MDEPESFEDSMAKLEEIVAALEKGNLSLDESLKQYEQGINALRHCEAFLKKAEQKVKVLFQDEDGRSREEAFEVTDSTDAKASPVTASEQASESSEHDQFPFDDDDDDEIPF